MKDLSYTLPDILPPEWQDCLGPLLSQMKNTNQLIWMAEYNLSCIKALKKLIGPSDTAIKTANEYLARDPYCLASLKETGILELKYQPVAETNTAILWLHSSSANVEGVRFSYCKPARGDWRYLKNIQTLIIEHSPGKYIFRSYLSLFLSISSPVLD